MPARVHDLRAADLRLPVTAILDASFLLELANRDAASEIRTFLDKLHRAAIHGQVKLWVTGLALEECYHKLIQKRYLDQYGRRWIDDGYKLHPELLDDLWPQLKAFEQMVLNLPAVIAEPEHLARQGAPALYRKMLTNIRDFHLLAKDAYISAEAQRLRVTDLITLDKDYDHLDGFTIYRIVSD